MVSESKNSITIHKDFYKDWVGLLRYILVHNWNYDANIVNSINDEKLPIYYFNADSRRVISNKRKVHCSDVFTCPSEYSRGWELFKQAVESGADLNPYLSKAVQNLTATDAMLNDWKIHHFHLGTELENGYIKRTGALVFTYITDTDMYIVNVFKHGDWAQDEIIETIHRNWPHLIKNCKLIGIKEARPKLLAKERKLLRKTGLNSMVAVGDGTVYGIIGGGTTMDGMSLQARRVMMRQRRFLKEFETHLDKIIDKIIQNLGRHGYDGISDLNAKLCIEGYHYYALFSEFNYAVTLYDRAS